MNYLLPLLKLKDHHQTSFHAQRSGLSSEIWAGARTLRSMNTNAIVHCSSARECRDKIKAGKQESGFLPQMVSLLLHETCNLLKTGSL